MTVVGESESDSMHNANILIHNYSLIHRKHHHNIKTLIFFYSLLLLFLIHSTRASASNTGNTEITFKRNIEPNHISRDSHNEIELFGTFLPWKVSRGARGYGKILRRFDRKYPEDLNEKLFSLNSDVQPQSKQIENMKNEKQSKNDDPKEKFK